MLSYDPTSVYLILAGIIFPYVAQRYDRYPRTNRPTASNLYDLKALRHCICGFMMYARQIDSCHAHHHTR